MENNTPLNTYGIKCPMKRNVGIAYNLYCLFIGNSFTEIYIVLLFCSYAVIAFLLSNPIKGYGNYK